MNGKQASQWLTLLPSIFQDLNGSEIALHALPITAKLGVAGLLALGVKCAAGLQGIPAGKCASWAFLW